MIPISYFKKRVVHFFESGLTQGSWARSCSLGCFIALSPLLGIQTPILFVLSPLFKANTWLVLTIVYVINNPWTMIPIVVFDYLVGYTLLRYLNAETLLNHNPSWMQFINNKIGPYLNSYLGIQELRIWCYIIGGIVVSCVAAIIIYPLAFKSYPRIKRAIHATDSKQ
jgi:uncharacterized protein (DUF2062 family)